MKLPTEQDFAAFAPGKTTAELCEHFNLGRTSITLLRRRTGIAGTPSPKFELPDDFRERAKSMSMSQLAKHYGVGSGTIQRLCDENGIKTKGLKPAKPRAPKKRISEKKFVNWGRPAAAPLAVDHTLAGQAANHLRRFYPTVHRMSIHEPHTLRLKGIPDGGKGHYQVGREVMTIADMCSLAKSMGWEG